MPWISEKLLPIIPLLGTAFLETLYMTLVSTLLAYLFGLPLGIILTVTAKDGLRPNRIIYGMLGFSINFVRSSPFLILLVAIMPFTRLVVGTTLGSTATIVPLFVASAPFVARMVESSLREVDEGVVEASRSMGASSMQIIFQVLLREARPSLLTGMAISITSILGYSAMAGFVGGGGLGSVAINHGYYRYNEAAMISTLCVLVIIVQFFQAIGMFAVRVLDKRRSS